MTNGKSLFNSFNNKNVLIIGDVMIDSYLWGNVNRISPEAPVPILNLQNREYRLGGAANVALNIKALGANAILCSVLGDDKESQIVYDLLEKESLSKAGISVSKNRITTIKHRVIASAQHLLRIDSEIDTNINQEEENELLSNIEKLIDNIDVIIFEDYDKGNITDDVIKRTVELAKHKNIPTIVDPKKRNFLFYNGVTLFKPNLKELREGLKIEVDNKSSIDELYAAAQVLQNQLNCGKVLVTLSENGVIIVDKNKTTHHKAHKREIADVSGAGDTVVSVAALCLANQVDDSLIASLSNLSGGIVCEHVGVVPINKNVLLDEAIKLGILE